MEAQFVEKYGAKLAESVEVESNGECLLWIGYIKHDSIYGQISCKVDGKWTTKPVHRLKYALDNDIHVDSYPSGWDISHLCHNPRCLRSEHLHLEPHTINNNRIHCKNADFCTSHVGHPDCMLHLVSIFTQFVHFGPARPPLSSSCYNVHGV